MLLFAVAIFDPSRVAVLSTHVAKDRAPRVAWRNAWKCAEMRGNAWRCVGMRGKLLQVWLFNKKVGEAPVRCRVWLLADFLVPTGLPPLKLGARLVAL